MITGMPKEHNTNSHVLIIATGGTIVSQQHPSGGLAPKKGLLQEKMKDFAIMENKEMPKVDVVEWEESIDSSYITPQHWVKLVKQIEENYLKYDGFVILHGTDTMAYTATALSFMLENLAKPVVFTGAAIPLGQLFNDAERNLVASLYVAAQADIPEVVICFSNKLTRANRTTKFDNWAQNSFESPNYPFLGRIGTNLSLFRDNILNPPKYKLKTFTNLFTNIGVIWLIPGFEDSIIQSTAKDENKKAIVLICYGSGNAPIENKPLQKLFEEISLKNIPVVITTQCLKGTINLDLYRVGRHLQSLGFISGQDMTIEACATKLAFLLGRNTPLNDLKIAMETNLRGELTTLTKNGNGNCGNYEIMEPISR